MRIETAIDIDGPPEAVWELLSQPARHPDFATPSDSIVELGEGEVREGSVYKEKGGIPPIKSVMTWTVAEVVPNRRLVSDGTDGKVDMHVDWDLEATASGTQWGSETRASLLTRSDAATLTHRVSHPLPTPGRTRSTRRPFWRVQWVDWFNHRRLFHQLGRIPPAEFETNHYRQTESRHPGETHQTTPA